MKGMFQARSLAFHVGAFIFNFCAPLNSVSARQPLRLTAIP